ncbi:SURF1 family cytochrome oxidase biogenesis protein [Nocardioides panaciterrulae]|uniref:SURF1-like protein n=1 Tax=Nocardioides panaciterrulae TaxID=661492 RepID=A0A7Y9E2H3_9ACTN|nr:cytochrome oxidase assembly protein ShyY1 [Nocardioides panaciterrulae]
MPSPLAPRYWGVHLLALVLTLAAVGLGVWQYDAWGARRAAEAQDLTRSAPVPLRSVIGPDAPFPGDRVGQPVVLDGTWVPGGTVYVSGREHDGQDGYWVVTPLAIPGAHDPAIPVVRGWVARPAQAPAPPTGTARMVGWLQPSEGSGEMDKDPGDDVLPQLRTADLLQHVHQDLYGAYAVVADRAAPGDWPVGAAATNDGTSGLVHADLQQLPPAGAFTALRNLFYAIEWWFFAGFAVFIWGRWVRDVRREGEPVETQATPGDRVGGEPAGGRGGSVTSRT